MEISSKYLCLFSNSRTCPNTFIHLEVAEGWDWLCLYTGEERARLVKEWLNLYLPRAVAERSEAGSLLWLISPHLRHFTLETENNCSLLFLGIVLPFMCYSQTIVRALKAKVTQNGTQGHTLPLDSCVQVPLPLMSLSTGAANQKVTVHLKYIPFHFRGKSRHWMQAGP